MKRDRGLFVVIEGCDGAGTSTQTDLLVTRLVRTGFHAVATREPTDFPVGKLIRQALRRELENPFPWETMALLFAADRMEHSRHHIELLMNQGTIVVSDRYDLSSLTYQSLTSGTNSGAALEWLRILNCKCVRPDRTFVLDVHAEVAAQRRLRRKGDPELFEVTELQERLAALYQRAEMVTTDPVTHINGNREVDTVAEDIWSSLGLTL